MKLLLEGQRPDNSVEAQCIDTLSSQGLFKGEARMMQRGNEANVCYWDDKGLLEDLAEGDEDHDF